MTRQGIPVAQIQPPPTAEKAKKSAFGCMRETIEIVDDFIEPLPVEDWEVMR